MIQTWKQVLILIVVFFVGIGVFSHLTNHETTDLTQDMAEATLPVVYLVVDEEKINELHGYRTQMDTATMRDTITPVESGGTLSVYVDCYGSDVGDISYEIRSLDLSRLVQRTEVDNYLVEGDAVTADLSIQNLLTEGEEYVLILEVTVADEPCYFYTRIIEEDNSYIGSCVAFVREFHDITMDKERSSELASYMEPQSGEDNATLQTVTINNSLSQACWGNLVGTEETEPSVSIKELNDTYNVILLTYILSSEDEDGCVSYYNVEEYYRVRQGTEKVYLLSFERTVEEIFQGSENQMGSDALVLGIRSADVDYMANSSYTVICFVQQGELWSYNTGTNKLTQVYSFRTLGETDLRENYNEHDIQIIRADESGSVDFIVYGYMNRGDHEGEVGISVCHYESTTNMVEELLFLPGTSSYQVMKEEIGQVMYISDAGVFYLLMGNQLLAVDLETLQQEVYLADLTEESCVASSDGRYLAWTSGDAYTAETLYITDLETGTTTAVDAPEDCYVQPLGFLESDCIYGIAQKSHADSGSAIFAMHQLVIVDAGDADLTVLKTYEAKEAYVTGVTFADGNIYLECARYSDGVYVETDSDTIYNRDLQEEESVHISEISDSIKQRQVTLVLAKSVSGTTSLLTSKQIINETSVTLDLGEKSSTSTYYVYAKGKVLLGTNRLAEAVICADENRGVVIGENQTYVWKRAKATSATASVYREVDAADAYNLTGCSLEQVLYFVGVDRAVSGLLYKKTVQIVGYSDTSVTIYSSEDQTTQTMLLSEAVEAFAESGNVFYVASE